MLDHSEEMKKMAAVIQQVYQGVDSFVVCAVRLGGKA